MPEYSADLPFADVNRTIIGGMRKPAPVYFLLLSALAMIIGWGLLVWIYQVKTGMGVTGINHPVGWGVYITNFVFWIGIAHSGTLISAILYLVRSQWRNSVSRATEAMTVFAVLTAGLFPLIHLGRLWVFYYIIPYPTQRLLFPDFMSPLVLDLMAVFTYLNVSVIFFAFGLIPDMAAVRDHYQARLGRRHWLTRIFRSLSLGWSGTHREWRHFRKSYLYFAMLATPLVVSVHSIVSWDFALSILPGWHSTIFPPYFVAGAIHSGLAMALTLLIPARRWLRLQQLITPKHLAAIAKLMVLTGAIVAYAYLIEPLIDFLSKDLVRHQFSLWRMTGPMMWIYVLTLVLNVAVPMTFIFRRARGSLPWLFVASLLVNLGMWLERYLIVVGSTAHDFMPHNWGAYRPTWVEISISAGMAAFFILLFVSFAKTLPVISISDFKDYLFSARQTKRHPLPRVRHAAAGSFHYLLVLSSAESLVTSVKTCLAHGLRDIETFSPIKVPEVEHLLGTHSSPVRYWTFLGGAIGCLSGYALTVGTAESFHLVVGGKHPEALFTYVLVMFELTVLLAAYANLIAALIYSRLYRRKVHPRYQLRFSCDQYGLLLNFTAGDEAAVAATFDELQALPHHARH